MSGPPPGVSAGGPPPGISAGGPPPGVSAGGPPPGFFLPPVGPSVGDDAVLVSGVIGTVAAGILVITFLLMTLCRRFNQPVPILFRFMLPVALLLHVANNLVPTIIASRARNFVGQPQKPPTKTMLILWSMLPQMWSTFMWQAMREAVHAAGGWGTHRKSKWFSIFTDAIVWIGLHVGIAMVAVAASKRGIPPGEFLDPYMMLSYVIGPYTQRFAGVFRLFVVLGDAAIFFTTIFMHRFAMNASKAMRIGPDPKYTRFLLRILAPLVMVHGVLTAVAALVLGLWKGPTNIGEWWATVPVRVVEIAICAILVHINMKVRRRKVAEPQSP